MNATPLVSAALGFVAGLAGGLLASTRPTPAPPVQAAPTQHDALISALIEEIRSLGERDSPALVTPRRIDSPRVPATQSQELLDAIERLTRAVDRLEPRRTEASSVPSADMARLHLDESIQAARVDAAAFKRKHMLWTTRQLVGTYGLPEVVMESGRTCLSWTYRREDGSSVRFTVADGLVTNAIVHL